MMKEKMVTVKRSTYQLLRNTYPLHYSVVCFGAPWDNFWYKPKKLTPIFYYFFY